MTLTTFQSGLPNPNPNYNTLGQLMYVPHGSSGTATFADVQTNEEEPVEHTGECFSVSASNDECFSVSVSESECFYINTGEEEVEPITQPTFEIYGFSSIKCIQAMGGFDLAVVGLYKPSPTSEERPVIAKISYSAGVSGGVGEILGVGYYVNLSDYEIEYSHVERLDGWDITTSLSSICIVAGDTHWLDPLLFTEQGNDKEFTNKGRNNPYFTETSYGSSYDSVVENTGWYSEETWTMKYYDGTLHPVYNYTYDYHPTTYSNYRIGGRSISDEFSIIGKEFSVYKMFGEGYETDDCCGTTENCEQEVSNGTVLSGWCHISHTEGSWGTATATGLSRDLIMRRGNLLVTRYGQYNYYISPPDVLSSFSYHYGQKHQDSNIDVWRRLQTVHTRSIDDTKTLPFNDADIGKKLCFDGSYYGVASSGSGFAYLSADGSKRGDISDAFNSTLISGVLLTANGTSEIKQTILDDVE